MRFTILVVDDEKNIREGLAESLRLDGYAVKTAADGAEGLKAVETGEIDLVITDLKMPALSGSDLLRTVSGRYPGLPVIVLTGHGTIEDAVDAMRYGAFDFLTKPVNLDPLTLLVKRALENRELARKNLELEAEVEAQRRTSSIIGSSAEMKRIFDLIRRVAPTKASVLITGESGVGKELVADAIHNLSPRKDGPLIKVHCAALAESLLESELFGHEKGAFTDAVSRRAGRFEAADGGTLFLDEVADLSLPAQAKVLRVLQEMRFERLGGEKTISVDVRVIAATNKDIRAEIAAGRFREDLYFRLAVVPIRMPALRDRLEDIPELCRYFLDKAAEGGAPEREISEEGLALLAERHWPGNVRELANFIERLAVMSDERLVSAQTVARVLGGGSADRPQPLVAQRYGELGLSEAKELFERDYLVQKLRECDYNVAKAADASGIHPSGLHAKIKKFGIEQER
jgi:DNA-binding NtrC family response regulator